MRQAAEDFWDCLSCGRGLDALDIFICHAEKFDFRYDL